MARLSFTVGALWRRSVRRALIKGGWPFTEDKGLLDSQFVVEGSVEQLERLQTKLHQWSQQVT